MKSSGMQTKKETQGGGRWSSVKELQVMGRSGGRLEQRLRRKGEVPQRQTLACAV
jgi:hypothetical protein